MTRYRLVYAGLALARLAVVGATWALSTEGEARPLPAVVERVSPAPGATVLRQASIVIDMVEGYSLDLEIDGRAIFSDQIQTIPGLGRFEWTPGPGLTYTEWPPGRHVVTISWNRTAGLPDIGSYSWEFRVQ